MSASPTPRRLVTTDPFYSLALFLKARMELEVLEEAARVVLAAQRNVLFAGWRDAPDVDAMRLLETTGRTEEGRRGPLVLINVAFGGRPSFSDGVRKAAARLTADGDLFQICRTHVVLMSGLTGTAVRAFMNTFILLGRPPRPTKMLGTLDAAVGWALPYLRRGPDEPEWTRAELRDLLSALEELAR